MRSVFALAAFALAGLVSAQDDGNSPIGNPFDHPRLAEQVPKGAPYEVTWEPTIDKAGTVTIFLLRGPSNNAVPQYAIAEKIPNSGSFSWTPSMDLESDTSRYGLKLVVDATGQYQYTPQFGISGADGGSGGGYPTGAPPTSEATGYPTAAPPASSAYPTPSNIETMPSYPTTIQTSKYPTAVPPKPSSSKSAPAYPTTEEGTTIVYPTGSAPMPSAPSGTGYPVPSPPAETPDVPSVPSEVPVPSTPAGTAPPSQTTIATGAAGKMGVGAVAVVAAVAAFAL